MENENDGGLNMDAAVDDIAGSLNLLPDEPETPEAPEPSDTPESPEQPQTPETPEQPAVRAVPKSWAKEYHDYWGKIDPKAQEYIELREKQMLDGIEKYKQYSGLGEQLHKVISPYKDFLTQQGVDEAKAVQYLLSAHHRLSSATPDERATYLRTLAQSYGIDLTGAQQTAQEEPPALKELRNKVSALETTLTQKQEQEYNAHKTKVATEVEAFFSDTKSNPYADEVADDMTPFLKAGLSLKDAYDKAVWANPVTRQKELNRHSEEQAKKLKENARLDALKADKARSANVRNRDTNRAPTEPLGTMEETMRATLKEIQERVH